MLMLRQPGLASADKYSLKPLICSGMLYKILMQGKTMRPNTSEQNKQIFVYVLNNLPTKLRITGHTSLLFSTVKFTGDNWEEVFNAQIFYRSYYHDHSPNEFRKASPKLLGPLGKIYPMILAWNLYTITRYEDEIIMSGQANLSNAESEKLMAARDKLLGDDNKALAKKLKPLLDIIDKNPTKNIALKADPQKEAPSRVEDTNNSERLDQNSQSLLQTLDSILDKVSNDEKYLSLIKIAQENIGFLQTYLSLAQEIKVRKDQQSQPLSKIMADIKALDFSPSDTEALMKAGLHTKVYMLPESFNAQAAMDDLKKNEALTRWSGLPWLRYFTFLNTILPYFAPLNIAMRHNCASLTQSALKAGGMDPHPNTLKSYLPRALNYLLMGIAVTTLVSFSPNWLKPNLLETAMTQNYCDRQDLACSTMETVIKQYAGPLYLIASLVQAIKNALVYTRNFTKMGFYSLPTKMGLAAFFAGIFVPVNALTSLITHDAVGKALANPSDMESTMKSFSGVRMYKVNYHGEYESVDETTSTLDSKLK